MFKMKIFSVHMLGYPIPPPLRNIFIYYYYLVLNLYGDIEILI